MRQIEKEMLRAVEKRANWHNANTETRIVGGVLHVTLHGNCIARFFENGEKYFTLAGWNTPTTRSRLNALGVGVSCRNFEPYANGKKIDANKWYAF